MHVIMHGKMHCLVCSSHLNITWQAQMSTWMDDSLPDIPYRANSNHADLHGNLWAKQGNVGHPSWSPRAGL